jgi:hypothetical protein
MMTQDSTTTIKVPTWCVSGCRLENPP